MQRVAIARAIVVSPLLILADEPTGNLDFETTCSILSLFKELRDEGATMILITHDDFVAQHCEKIIHLHDGLTVASKK